MFKSLFGRLGGKARQTGQAAQAQGGASTDVTPAEAWQRAKSGGLLLDVREPAEWQSGHAPGATLLPLGQLGARLGTLPREGEIITVCRSGGRSGAAASQLRQAGFTRVYNMAGGMNAWARAGLPVQRGLE